ncbi:MAG: hypothetical protein HKN41_09150 [Ilumatobacter sp.]|nr:hypothetical protein [Ilumatobacter sp.]
MRLGIDLDGVVADFNSGWMRLHADEFGSRLTTDMVDSWDGLHHVGGFADMSEFWAWARGNGDRPSIFRHLDPYPGAVESLHELVRVGHRIVVVTTKPRWARADTFHWLADHGVPSDEVHIVDRKHEVDCDVYLDDAPHVLHGLVRHRPEATICRFVRAWNDSVPGAVDVTSWADFLEVVARHPVG